MWDDVVAWLQSPGGARVIQSAVVPALAILVAGVIAALIGRAAVRSTIHRADRVEAAGAVAGLVEAARAATDPEAARGDQRRAARLRTEADVRTRLLPLPGAATAADWAAARTDALRRSSSEGPVTADLDDLRDRLVRWVQRPGRAKRIFVAPIPKPQQGSTIKSTRAAKSQAAAEDQAAAGPRRQGAVAARPDGAAPVAEGGDSAPPSPAIAVAAGEAVPAWQRTRSGGRLQQERDRGRGRPVEAPPKESRLDELHTAPVQVPHTHRAEAVAVDTEEAIRLEAHQQAKHARPVDPAQTPADADTPGGAKTGVTAPAWLDVYDDEAQVTQNLDLKTPPPLAASAVRDRGTGEDLVPRS